MRIVVYLLLVLLMILHHDVWNWETHKPLVFGFIPAGLAHHAGISLSAAVLWALAVKFAWPQNVDLLDEPAQTEGEQ